MFVCMRNSVPFDLTINLQEKNEGQMQTYFSKKNLEKSGNLNVQWKR